LKEDPLQHGYSRVNQQAADGTLSNSTTSTSLDTVVIDTSTDNISNSPKFQQKKQKTFSPILETDDSNPFKDDLKELALRSKKSNLKGGHISFGEDEEEANDKFDEEAFKKKREHFQKTKSRSEHKSLILRVSACVIAVRNEMQTNRVQ
jgi:facilitated trehalose transporter